MNYKQFEEEALAWHTRDVRRDDLNTMDNPEEQLDSQGIEDWEEGFIRGYMESA